ncbi:Thermonuclease precursor (plasmid) [Variovorax sp. PBS-H4]|uniref:thermonuclease family protein n=1 Tax=Variovorax sp. PBS-H4 TaxID=434008 RepID=UPI00131944B0|nr:thermonuclease family protein [Variovorax sp. PBS-H4]VTU41384.1 Thermonuclease precursor [Variovorax sp. PBS-H4]
MRDLFLAAAVGLVCVGCQPFTTAPPAAAPEAVEQLQPAVAPAGPYPVAYVIDGDTIAVITDPGADPVRVRLIGLDSPEDTQTLECFGPEATARTTELLAAISVWLETDPSQGEVDKYGCTPAFVWTGPDGGTLVNAELIAGGFAHEYTYDQPRRYQQQFQARENTARTTGVGLWSADTCDGGP